MSTFTQMMALPRPIRAQEIFLAARFAARFEQWGLRLISSIKCALSSLGAEFFAS